LQGVAPADSVVIADATRRLIGDLFELEDLGAQELKGFAGATRAFAVLRVRAVESRFEAFHAGGLTSLVGRGEEIEILQRCWAKARSGEGQVVLLSGEPGIGKSRLAAALMERLADEPHMRMRYFCSPQHVDSAFYPIIRHLERAAGFAAEDDPKTRLDKLDALLARSPTSPEDSGLLADLLGLGNDGRYPVIELSPIHRRQQTLAALVGQIEALSRATPALLVFEDTHWADPTSLEMFDRLFERIERLSALAIVTFRCGRYDEGSEKADQAIAVSSEIGDRWCLPRTHEIRGRLLLQTSRNADAAEQDLIAAVSVARSQCAKGSELRAATSLARLWRDQGKSTQACGLLAPIYSWFTEGFDTPDLKEARALLNALAP
jgi:hypothetical protein